MRILILIAVSVLWSAALWAQDSSSSMALPSDPTATSTVHDASGDDVDAIITNNKMRTETGSKSRYSIASSLSYSAGPVNSPFAEYRPNLSASTGQTDYTSLTGDVSLKYNINVQNSVFGGVGLRWITPTQGFAVPPGYNGNKFDADNPYINYQYLYRWSDIQSAFIFNETFYSNTNLVREGFVTAWNVSQNNVYDIGNTGITAELEFYAGAGVFNNNSFLNKQSQSDYDLGISPALEYRLTPKLNLRTDSNPLSFQHMRSASGKNSYDQQVWTQTFSLGWSITRDIYLYPGVEWVDAHLRTLDQTVAWVTTDINLF